MVESDRWFTFKIATRDSFKQISSHKKHHLHLNLIFEKQ